MIDPRFATAGAVPFATGYGVQQVPFQQQYLHQQHHHHHHKSRNNVASDSPLSRDESIHRVDYGRHNIQQNDGAPFTGGYGVPYGAGGFSAGGGGAPGGFHPQAQPQPQFYGGNYGFGNQYQQTNVYDQGQYAAGPGAPVMKQRRRHHRHHRSQVDEAVTGSGVAEQTQGVPEQLIGQRSSSVLGNEAPPQSAEGEVSGDQRTSRRHRHRRHQHQQQSSGQASFSQSGHAHTTAGADGYGHINEELIFIERGEHSPHRQEPPPGYEYKGKIEVQNTEKVYRSQSQGQSQGGVLPTVQPSIPVQQPTGPCPPGWQQMVVSAAPGGPCPPGATLYTGQLGVGVGVGVGAGAGVGVAQPGIGGLSGFGSSASGVGFGGAGPIGAAGSGAGLANLAASLPFPPQGQLIADYIVESNAGGAGAAGTGVTSAGGSGFLNDYQQTTGGSFTNQASQAEESVTTRPTIIEVWQKRNRYDVSEPTSGSTKPSKHKPSFDFERFRAEILGAIERLGTGTGTKIQWTGHDGGTQTQINPSTDVIGTTERRTTGSGEVRVIVQPIQPVFYMPRQGETTTATTGQAQTFIQSGPAPAIQQSGGSNVVYVPRNVYVPVIKPVFVPRERVIVRPQVIHVARPVLVDRPVPVTQRPIIIDRERPVPVPTRCTNQDVTQTATSQNIQQDFGYQDNASNSYVEQSAGFVNTANYDYTPTQQEQQYTTTSTQEVTGEFQIQEPAINITGAEQYQDIQSTAHLNVDQSGASFQESYSNFAQADNASAAHVTSAACAAPIDVLDATFNPNWQRTDKASLVQRYGRPAHDIVQRTDQTEQQMYQELRQRTSSGGVQRSGSAASYGSGLGAVGGGANYNFSSSSYSTTTVGDLQNYNTANAGQQRSSPVCINY